MPKPPTPNFLISSRLVINSRPVRWIEVKNFYALGIERGLKSWTPTLRIQKQIAKYIEAYRRDGAAVFKHGFAQKFQAWTPVSAQLLDGARAGL